MTTQEAAATGTQTAAPAAAPTTTSPAASGDQPGTATQPGTESATPEAATPAANTGGDADGGSDITYTDFSPPEGIEKLDTAALDRALPIFKELKLTQDQAQSLVGLYASELQAAVQGAYTPEVLTEQLSMHLTQQSNDWLVKAKADPEIGGSKFEASVKAAQEAAGKVGTPEFKQLLIDTGLGNNPEFIRMFAKLAPMLREDRGGLAPTGGGGAPTSLKDRMYPQKPA